VHDCKYSPNGYLVIYIVLSLEAYTIPIA
jgi:hypothetical protein